MKRPGAAREHRLNLRLNDREKTVVDKVARNTGIPAGTFGRQSILNAAEKLTKSEEIDKK